jgi:TonB family protein
MKGLRDKREEPPLLIDSFRSESTGLLKTGIFSLVLHVALLALVALNLKPGIPKGSRVYHVTLRPFSAPGGGIQQAGPGLGTPSPPTGPSLPPAVENLKSGEISKGREVVETKQKKPEKSEIGLGKKTNKREESLEKERGSLKSLQEAIEDVHKKVALDEIQKRVSRRGGYERGAREGPPTVPPQAWNSLSSGSSSASGSGSGTGPGSGVGTGPGSGGLPGGSVWGSSAGDSKLNEYYSMIWAKIKEEWTLPENLPKGKTDLETIIVVLIDRGGKLQKSWFEKRSGNALYDQMAMRAIKKAEPFPPIPKEFSDSTFEIGIRFHPD